MICFSLNSITERNSLCSYRISRDIKSFSYGFDLFSNRFFESLHDLFTCFTIFVCIIRIFIFRITFFLICKFIIYLIGGFDHLRFRKCEVFIGFFLNFFIRMLNLLDFFFLHLRGNCWCDFFIRSWCGQLFHFHILLYIYIIIFFIHGFHSWIRNTFYLFHVIRSLFRFIIRQIKIIEIKTHFFCIIILTLLSLCISLCPKFSFLFFFFFYFFIGHIISFQSTKSSWFFHYF